VGKQLIVEDSPPGKNGQIPVPLDFEEKLTRMSFQIRWVPSPATSCLHAAHALHSSRPVVDERLHAALAAPTQDLHSTMLALGLDAARLWRQLLCMAHQFENKRQLAQITLFRAFGTTQAGPALLVELEGRLGDLQRAYLALFPDVAQELTLRGGPLREQWEARGPGMLRHAGNLFRETVVVPGADVLLVQPVRGGYGEAQLYNNTVRFEAVLANPESRLPESVRLLWNFLQLNLDVPVLSELVHGDRLPLVASLAMLPAALEAALAVELVADDPALLELALTLWHVDVADPADAALKLAAWWEEFRATQPSLRVALPALAEMFAPADE
jgi:hypothetical protein